VAVDEWSGTQQVAYRGEIVVGGIAGRVLAHARLSTSRTRHRARGAVGFDRCVEDDDRAPTIERGRSGATGRPVGAARTQ